MGKRGSSYFIVVDGIDGAGKGVAVNTIREFFRERFPHIDNIFDLEAYWQRFHMHPQFEDRVSAKKECLFDYVDPDNFRLVISSEPTHTDIGNTIRTEIISNKGKYTAKFTAEMYAADRHVLYKRALIPALNMGKIWVQSRSVSTSIVYQQVQAAELGEALKLDQIISLEGNQTAIQNPPNLLIIPTIKDVEKALERTKRREKDDKTWFESIDFQLKLKPHYESSELKSFFEELGTKVEYVDGGAELKEYTAQIIDVLERNKVKEQLGLDKVVNY